MLFRGAWMRTHMMCEAREGENWKVKSENEKETNKFKLTIIINQN